MNAMTKLRCRRGHQRARRILPLLLLTVAAWASVALGPVPRVFALESSASDPARGSGHRTVTFAALLPLTGDSTHSGQAAFAAVQLAMDEINDYFAAKGIDLRIELAVLDTESDPDVARKRLQTVKDAGFPPIVLGPESSAEVAAVREYANEHDILVISYASTAPSLAIAGDNVFRPIPNDRLEAEALAVLAREVDALPFRADVVIPMYRDDVFGNDLATAFAEAFTRRGGSVVEPGIAYDPKTEDFSELVDQLNDAVERARAADATARAAVYLIAFDEAAHILREAGRHESLLHVLWYGSNATAQSGALVNDDEAAAFAAAVKFISPAYVPDVDTLQTLPVQLAQIRARLGREPEPFAQVARESLWLMALSYLRTGEDNPDAAALRAAFLNLTGDTGSYRGSIGGVRALLDETGDGLYGNTGFFLLEKHRDGYRWVRRAQLYRSPIHEPYWKFHLEPDPFERTAGLNVAADEERTVIIGALLPLSGIGPDVDPRVQDVQVALEFAQDDINSYLRNIGSPYRVMVRIEDTQADPEAGLAGLKRLAAEGIRIVIGPMRSDVAAGVLDYANEEGILLLSPSSTTPALAIPGDNLYRLVPADTLQAKAVTQLMEAEGVKAVLPLYMGDIYGDELVAQTTKYFDAAGGTVLEGIRYAPGTTDFAAAVGELGQAAERAIRQFGPDGVAVYVIAFDEITAMLEAAAGNPWLTQVRWYGSDAHALYPGVVRDDSVGAVAASVKLTSPAYRINPSGGLHDVFMRDYEMLTARLQRRLGRFPTDFATVSYGAVWWAARAHFASGDSRDPEALKQAFEAIIMPETGLSVLHVTGEVLFNEAGDQSLGYYLFYRVVEEDGGFRWKEYALFRSDYEREGIDYR